VILSYFYNPFMGFIREIFNFLVVIIFFVYFSYIFVDEEQLVLHHKYTVFTVSMESTVEVINNQKV
jgi:hypothetical protein